MELIFDKHNENFIKPNYLPKDDLDGFSFNLDFAVPPELRKKDECFPNCLPNVPEVDIIRHFINLSHENYSVDTGIYTLGSCTMKYNPKINERIAKLEEFTNIHPLQPESLGCNEIIDVLQEKLQKITGMDDVTLQPAAGAHGELTGMFIFKQYFEEKGLKKDKIIVPTASHGTNPASAAMAGFSVIELDETPDGEIDLAKLEETMKMGDVAGIMLTNPNTLGLFDRNILKITEIVHKYDGLCYYDGANLNAIIGICRPGDMGFDIVHMNLHKTFSTPHGGGGPGSGPIGVKSFLSKYLPENAKRVRAFYGNFGVYLRAFAYLLAIGDNIDRVAKIAVLNANYLRVKLQKLYHLPYNRICMHEFVLSDKNHPNGVSTEDLAKRMIDYGIHPPTIFFPLIVHGALMIEPTETESLASLDKLIEIYEKIYEEAKTNPELIKKAPTNTKIRRLDPILAAKKPVLKWPLNK